jgi:hypothetical protein
MLPPERPAIANVAVTKLLAPTQANSGESLNLKVVLDNQNDRPVEGTLSPIDRRRDQSQTKCTYR